MQINPDCRPQNAHFVAHSWRSVNSWGKTRESLAPQISILLTNQTALLDCEFPLQVHYLQNMVSQSFALLVLKKGWKDKVTGRQCPLNNIPTYSSSLFNGSLRDKAVPLVFIWVMSHGPRQAVGVIVSLFTRCLACHSAICLFGKISLCWSAWTLSLRTSWPSGCEGEN